MEVKSEEGGGEYGLRRRGKDGKSAKDDGVEKLGKGWLIPVLPENRGIKGLGKNQIKGDLKAIRETLEDRMIEDNLNSEEEYAYSRIEKGNYGGGEQAADSSSYMGSNNFYFPFKKMKEWGELGEYLDFVNQSTYLSMRHAYVQQLEMLRIKRQEQQRVLGSLDNIYKQRLERAVDAEEFVTETESVLDKALEAIEYYKEKATLLAEENRLGSPAIRTRKSKQGTSRAEKLARLRVVATKYGVGVLKDIRLDGTVCVKLKWGATSFLQIQDLGCVSREMLRQLDGPNKVLERILSTEEQEQQEEQEPVVMYTKTEYGPPRGVPLHISNLSDEPHFALPPAHLLQPGHLKTLYQSKGILVSHSSLDPELHAEEQNADFDLRTLARERFLQTVPFSWGAKDNTPWATAGTGLERSDLAAWQKERADTQALRAKVNLLQNKLKTQSKLLESTRVTLAATQKLNADLVGQIIATHKDSYDWKTRCAHVLHDDHVKRKHHEDSSPTKRKKKGRPKRIKLF